MATERFFVGGLASAPERVACDSVGYPHRDAEGRVQYDNTHFDTEAEAWERLIVDAESNVEHAGSKVGLVRKQLRDAEEWAGRAAERFADVRSGFAWFQRRAATEADR